MPDKLPRGRARRLQETEASAEPPREHRIVPCDQRHARSGLQGQVVELDLVDARSASLEPRVEPFRRAVEQDAGLPTDRVVDHLAEDGRIAPARRLRQHRGDQVRVDGVELWVGNEELVERHVLKIAITTYVSIEA